MSVERDDAVTEQAEPVTTPTEAAPAEVPEPKAEEKVEPEKQPDKTYTQAELDAIVQRRLAKAKRSEADTLRQEVEELKRRIQPPQAPQATAEPKRENFEDYDAFVRAQAEHAAKDVARREFDRLQKEAAAKAEQEKRNKTVREFEKRQEQARQQFEDYDDAIASLEVSFPDGFMDAIVESDKGAEVAYFLATHKDEAERIAGLGRNAAIRELGKLEAKLEKPAVTRTTKAPQPLAPVSGSSAGLKFDPYNDDDMEAYVKWRRGK